MTTGTKIVQDALRKIGAHSVAAPADAEFLELGKNNLNSMLEMWLSRGINFGFSPLKVIGGELDEPADVRNGIICNLAIWMAPDFDNGKVVVSPELRGQARSQFHTIDRLYRSVTIPAKVVSSTLPRGQGNSDNGFRNQAFFKKGDIITN